MKPLQSIFLFKVDSDHLEKACAHLHEQINSNKLALFYVKNEEVTLPSEASYLSKQEVSELESFGIQERRNQYLISRWLSKSLLGSLLGIPAIEVSTIKGALGKPYLEDELNFLKIDFNISHTKEITLVGIAHQMQIGVDVEKVAMKRSSEVAARFFTPPEAKWLAEGQTPQEQVNRFFRIWSMKEAVIKAVGGGVFQNIKQITFQEEHGSLILLSSIEPWSLKENWQLLEFNEIEGHACSVALFCHS